MSDQVRIDKWLWAARFFKTRAVARAAIEGGKVQHNDNRVKPSKVLKLGDELRVLRGEDEFHITVQGLSDKRGPAEQARQLYEESTESIQQREARAEQRRLQRSLDARPERRPNKRERRQISRFKTGR